MAKSSREAIEEIDGSLALAHTLWIGDKDPNSFNIGLLPSSNVVVRIDFDQAFIGNCLEIIDPRKNSTILKSLSEKSFEDELRRLAYLDFHKTEDFNLLISSVCDNYNLHATSPLFPEQRAEIQERIYKNLENNSIDMKFIAEAVKINVILQKRELIAEDHSAMLEAINKLSQLQAFYPERASIGVYSASKIFRMANKDNPKSTEALEFLKTHSAEHEILRSFELDHETFFRQINEKIEKEIEASDFQRIEEVLHELSQPGTAERSFDHLLTQESFDKFLSYALDNKVEVFDYMLYKSKYQLSEAVFSKAKAKILSFDNDAATPITNYSLNKIFVQSIDKKDFELASKIFNFSKNRCDILDPERQRSFEEGYKIFTGKDVPIKQIRFSHVIFKSYIRNNKFSEALALYDVAKVPITGLNDQQAKAFTEFYIQNRSAIPSKLGESIREYGEQYLASLSKSDDLSLGSSSSGRSSVSLSTSRDVPSPYDLEKFSEKEEDHRIFDSKLEEKIARAVGSSALLMHLVSSITTPQIAVTRRASQKKGI